MRQEGYYWVKPLKGGMWIMGLFVHSCKEPYWIIMGQECILTDSDLHEIDEQLILRKI